MDLDTTNTITDENLTISQLILEKIKIGSAVIG